MAAFDRWLTGTLALAGILLAGCGNDNGGGVRTVTVTSPSETLEPETSDSAPVDGDGVLIETRITNARRHTGEVLRVSVIGESPFCRGGETSGGSDGPTITTTFRCPDGTLTVRFAPTQPSRVQSGIWEVASGTGSYKGLRGGGSMVAKFEKDDPDKGGEIFTGTLGK